MLDYFVQIGRRLGRQILRTVFSWTNRSYGIAMGFVGCHPVTHHLLAPSFVCYVCLCQTDAMPPTAVEVVLGSDQAQATVLFDYASVGHDVHFILPVRVAQPVWTRACPFNPLKAVSRAAKTAVGYSKG